MENNLLQVVCERQKYLLGCLLSPSHQWSPISCSLSSTYLPLYQPWNTPVLSHLEDDTFTSLPPAMSRKPILGSEEWPWLWPHYPGAETQLAGQQNPTISEIFESACGPLRQAHKRKFYLAPALKLSGKAVTCFFSDASKTESSKNQEPLALALPMWKMAHLSDLSEEAYGYRHCWSNALPCCSYSFSEPPCHCL